MSGGLTGEPELHTLLTACRRTATCRAQVVALAARLEVPEAAVNPAVGAGFAAVSEPLDLRLLLADLGLPVSDDCFSPDLFPGQAGLKVEQVLADGRQLAVVESSKLGVKHKEVVLL